jgi:hypothetical protein
MPATSRAAARSGDLRRQVVSVDRARQMLWSDPVPLAFVRDAASLRGRKLAVSFHVAGPAADDVARQGAAGRLTSRRRAVGVHSRDEDDGAFPYSTASWFFLDAVDMSAPAGTAVVACFGDSITDGTASTMNGDDRWPDVFAQRLQRALRQPRGRWSMPASAAIASSARPTTPTKPSPAAPARSIACSATC